MPAKGTTGSGAQGPTKGPEAALKELRDMVDKGDWKQALAGLDELQQATPKNIETRPVIATCHLLRARALLHMGDLTKAWAEGDRAIAIAKEAGRPAIEAEAMCAVANVHWKKGRLDKALEILEKASAAAKLSKDERVQGIVSLEKATVHMKTQAYDDAEREYRDAILALEKVGEQRQLARAYNNFAHVFYYQGLWEKAEEMFLKCRRLSEKAGFRSIGAWAAFNRAEALLELKRVDEARKELDWAMPILEALGDTYGLVVTNSIYSVVHAMEKDFVKADASLEKARQLNQKIDIPHMKGRLAYYQGLVCKYRGEKARAIKLFKEAKEVYVKIGSTSEVHRIEKELKALS